MKTNHFYHRVLWLTISLLTLFNLSVRGAGAISVSAAMKIYPSGSTTVSQGDWKNAGAPTAYSTTATDKTINSDGSFTFYNAADYNNASNLLQLKASGGYIETTISSSAGVDVFIGYKTSGNSLTITLTDGTTQNVSSGSFQTAVISTTNTSATLKIHKNSASNAYISYIAIVPKQAGGNGDYVLVENAGDISAGKYLIVYNNATAMNTHNGNTNANTYSTISSIFSYYSNKKIEANATTNALAYEIVASPNGYAIKKSSENTFLGFNSTAQNPIGSYLRWDTKFSESSNEWTIGVNSIVSYFNSSYAIRYNSGSTRFAIYTTSGQSEVQIFKKVDSGCDDLASLNGSVSSSTASSVVLEWDKIEGVDYDDDLGYGPFIVDVTPSASTTVGDIDLTGSKATCEVTGLTPCTEYTFTILANKDNSGDYCDDTYEEVVFTPGAYTYTVNTTHVSTSDVIPDTQCDGDISATFGADDGYSLPSSITVTGASTYTWEDGVLSIDADDVTGDVSVTIIGVQYTASFSTGIGNPSVSSLVGGEVVFPAGVTPAASSDGWEFAGWASAECGWQTKAPHMYSPGDSYDLTADKTFYAVYRKHTSGTSTITFTASGSDFEQHEYYAKDWVDKTGGTEMYLTSGSFTSGTRWNVAASDEDKDEWYWVNIYGHRKIKSVVFSGVSGYLLDDSYVWNDVDNGNGSHASMSTSSTTQTVTCSGDVTALSISSQDGVEARFTAVNITYYNAKFFSNPICDGYTFHAGNDGDAANLWTITKFNQVDATNEWRINNYTITNKTHFYVGRDGAFMNGTNGNLGTSAVSNTVSWATSPSYSDGKWQGQMILRPNDNYTYASFGVGQATGAIGTLNIYDDSGDKNLFVGFTPAGYGITYGGSGKAFTETATSHVWESYILTLPDVSSTTYTMGLKTATAGTYVSCSHSKSAENINAMGVTNVGKGKIAIYLAPGSFDAASAKYAVWDMTNSAFDGFMTDPDGDGIYVGYVGSSCVKIILVRLNSNTTDEEIANSANNYKAAWDKKWNQTTGDGISISGNLAKKYTITNLSGDNCTYSSENMKPITGQSGKFRMYDNDINTNWNVRFVPYFKLGYDKNGGTGSMSATYRDSESSTQTVTVANNGFTAPTGKHFTGWKTGASSGDNYAAESSYTLMADGTLYAQWAWNTYTITYNKGADGSGDAISEGTKTYGVDYTISSSTYTRTGYRQTGWATSDGDSKAYNLGATYTTNADLDLYPYWEANTYTVSFDKNDEGATGSMDNQNFTYDVAQNLTSCGFSKTGWSFDGWATTYDGSVVYSNGQEVSNLTATHEGSVTLYAKWSINDYRLTWDLQGGTVTVAGTGADVDDTGTPYIDVTYGDDITAPTVTKTGYTFSAWSPSVAKKMPAANTTYTATWTINQYNVAVEAVAGVTITATPAGGSAISEGNNANVDYNKSVTLAYSGLETGIYWVGWKVLDGSDNDVTNDVVDGSTLTVPAYNVKVTAVLGKMKAWCMPDFEITGDIHLTSVKDVYVNSTSTTGDLLTFSGTDMHNVTRITIDYLDNNGDVVATKNTSPLRLRAGDNSGYAETDITSGFSTGTYSGSFSVRFTPTAYDEVDNYKLRLTIKKGSRVLKTVEHPMNGRALPEEFVIAVKQNDQWYALPNTIVDNNRAITPLKITVNNATTPTAATYAPSTAVYKGDGRYASGTNIYGIRFTDGVLKDAKYNHLEVSSSSGTNYVWLSYTGSSTCNDWWLSSSDFHSYTLKVPSSGAGDKSFGINNLGNIGFFASDATNLCKEVFLLPITNKYSEIAATVSEWGQHSVIVEPETRSDLLGVASATMNIGTADPTAATTTAINAVMGTAKRVKVADVGSDLDIGVIANEGKSLYIHWKNGGGTEIGVSQITIPTVIAASNDMKSIAGTKAAWAAKSEVYVLPGVTLDANAGSFTGDGALSVSNLHLYPGATLKVSTGTFNATTLRMHNGWTRAGTKKYDVARVYIADDAALTKTTASMDYDIYELSEGKHFYPLAVPFSVAVSAIDYADTWLAGYSNYGMTGQYVIKEYNGARRAEVGPDQENNWTPVASDATLSPGKGYIMTAIPVYGEAIIRIPLTYDNGWTSDGEKATYDAVTKNVISVTAHVKAEGETKNANKGWNLLGVPFMSCYATSDDMGTSVVMQGKFDFETGEWKEDDVRYVNVPLHDFSEYVQVDMEDDDPVTVLRPGWCFFVQIGTTGSLTFLTEDQAQSSSLPIYAPKRTAEMPTVKTGIILSGNGASDKTTLLISDKYNGAEYEINADLEKMFGNGYTLATYSLAGSTRLAYNAMSRSDAQLAIPIGYRAPAEGSYTFSINPRYAESGAFSRVDLIDCEAGTLTNLLMSDYTFSTERTQNDTRFAINVVLAPQVTTDIESVNGEGLEVNGVRKVLINNELYIVVDGKMFDATGKAVK